MHILRYVPAFAYCVTANADWHMTYFDVLFGNIFRHASRSESYVAYLLNDIPWWDVLFDNAICPVRPDVGMSQNDSKRILLPGGKKHHETFIKPAILGYPLGARVLTHSPAPLPRHKMEDLPSNPWPCHPGLCQGISVVSGICPDSPSWNLTMGRVSIFLHKP